MVMKKPGEISKRTTTKPHYTKKQYNLAQVWVSDQLNNTGLSFTEMALRAGYPKTTATIQGRRTLMKEGTQYAIAEITKSMKESLIEAGVGPEYLASKVRELLEGRFEKDVNFRAIHHGLEHALKIGIGGGYAPMEQKNLNLNVTVSPEDLKKYKPLKDEYEEKLRAQEIGYDSE